MANLPETETYDAGVYQLESTDPVIGGVDGKSNASARNLANRTKWLKARVDELISAVSNTLATKLGVQDNTYLYAVATGTTSAYLGDYELDITELVDGMVLHLGTQSVGTNAIAAPTFSPNELTERTIVKENGAALGLGDMPNHALLRYDSANTRWILLNPAFGRLNAVTSYLTAGTYTFTAKPDTRFVIVEVQGAGGGSGGCQATPAGYACGTSAGGAGYYVKHLLTTGFSGGVTVTVGTRGVAGVYAVNHGGTGGTSSFGALVTASGGNGSLSNAAVNVFPSNASSASGGTSGTTGNICSSVGQASTQLLLAGLFIAIGGTAYTDSEFEGSNGSGAVGRWIGQSTAATAGFAAQPGAVVVWEYA